MFVCFAHAGERIVCVHPCVRARVRHCVRVRMRVRSRLSARCVRLLLISTRRNRKRSLR